MGWTERDPLHDYYELGRERDRLDEGTGLVEFARTTEILRRHLPRAPAEIADLGGGPGRYAVWLAGLGHRVRHRDVVPLHVEQAAAATAHLETVDTAVGDALDVELDDASVDAVLLLGPLYHLPRSDDRRRALGEARRIVRPGGVVAAAAITRWAARIHGVLVNRLYDEVPHIVGRLPEVERTGELPPVHHASFTGYSHRPDELADEIGAADLDLVELVNVEGPAGLLADIDERMANPRDAAIVLDAARALERVPELLGVGPHLLAIARRPGGPVGAPGPR